MSGRSRLYSSLTSKYRTYDQAVAAQEQAIRFASDVLEDDDLADDLASESVESYADRKGLIITNPLQRRRTDMANGNGDNMSKDDLQDCIETATSILEAAYVPEADRETLAAAIGDALDALAGDYDEDDDDDDAAA